VARHGRRGALLRWPSDPRYKCDVCPDYDLCSSCEAKNLHPNDHPLIKLKVSNRLSHCFRGGWRRPHADVHCMRRRCPESDTKEEQREKHEQKSEAKQLPNVAQFVRDVNLSETAQVMPGQTLMKNWEFINAGTAKWPEGTSLLFVQGDRELLGSGEEFSVPLADVGQKVAITCPIKVPTKSGRFHATFQLVDKDRIPFEGHRCWVELVVANEEKKEMSQSDPSLASSDSASSNSSASSTSASSSSSSTSSSSTSSSVSNFDPNSSVSNPDSSHSPPKTIEIDPLYEKFKGQMITLVEMGFTNQQSNFTCLERAKGNLEQAVVYLITL